MLKRDNVEVSVVALNHMESGLAMVNVDEEEAESWSYEKMMEVLERETKDTS